MQKQNLEQRRESTDMGQNSEVARLLAQINSEYEAAGRGLSGLAQGTSQHRFMTKRMENIAAYHVDLQKLVGKDEAMKLIAASQMVQPEIQAQ
jgi:hypothetical protein